MNSNQIVAKRFPSWGVGLVGLLFILMLVACFYESPMVMTRPFLVGLLNTLFLGILPLVLIVLATKSYLSTGARTFLWMGGGLFSLALSNTLAGWALDFAGGEPNPTVILGNFGALWAGGCHLASAFFLVMDLNSEEAQRGSPRSIYMLYGCTILALALLAIAVSQQLLPPLFTQGVGPTPLRQWILGIAMMLLATSSILYLAAYFLTKSQFAYWYSLALLLMAMGMLCFFLQSVVGGLVCWTGRTMLYLCGLYFLLGLWHEERDISASAAGGVLRPFFARKMRERIDKLAQTNLMLQAEIKERELAQEELHHSRALLQAIIEGTSDAIFVKDLQGRYVLCNSATARFVGKSVEEILGHDDLFLFPPCDAAAVMAGDSKVMAGGKVMTYEDIVTTTTGCPSTFLTTKGPLMDATGKTVGMFGISRDVSERKRFLNALQESEEKYRHLFEAESDAILLVDNETGTILEANRAVSTMYGYTKAELMAANNADLSAEPEATIAVTRHKSANDENFVTVPQRYHRKKDGTIFPVELTIRYFTQQHRQLHIVAIRDISERKKNEQRLQRNEALLNTTQRLTRVGSWEWDLLQRTMFWTEETYRIHDMDPAELIITGEPLRMALSQECVVPQDRPQLLASYQRCIDATESFDIELRFVTPRGKSLWVRVGGFPMTAEGKVNRVIGFIMDITDHKMEAQALKEAKQEAESANKAKSQFLAKMSHELRTPMNAIIGMTDLTLETAITATQRQYLEFVKNGAYRLLALINDLLDLSKVESGKMEFAKIPFSLSDIIHEMVESYKTVIGSKPIVFECLREDDLPDQLIGDPQRLHQILSNLVGNAVKFTKVGSITLRIESLAKSASEVTLKFAVTDTGIGIPADKIDRLFHYFSQMDESIHQKYGGAGLGLLIAKELTQKMGGDIGVMSEPDKGSTFHFTAIFQRSGP